jgi:hypothetical protein
MLRIGIVSEKQKPPRKICTGAILFNMGQVLVFSNNAATLFQLSPHPVPPRVV